MPEITSAKIIESLVLYAIIHGIVGLYLWITKPIRKRLQTERDHLLAAHIRRKHGGRFAHCDTCHTPIMQTVRQERAQQTALVSLEQ